MWLEGETNTANSVSVLYRFYSMKLMSMTWGKLIGMWDFRHQQKSKKAIKQLTGTLTVIMRHTGTARLIPARCRKEIEAAHNHMTWKIPVCPNTVTHTVPHCVPFPFLFSLLFFFFFLLPWFYFARSIQYLIFSLYITIFINYSFNFHVACICLTRRSDDGGFPLQVQVLNAD